MMTVDNNKNNNFTAPSRGKTWVTQNRQSNTENDNIQFTHLRCFFSLTSPSGAVYIGQQMLQRNFDFLLFLMDDT